MKTLLLFAAVGFAAVFAATPGSPKKEAPRKDSAVVVAKPVAQPAAKPFAVTAAMRTGESPRSGVIGTDAFGRTQTRYDNGVTAVTTPDPFGGSSTRFSNGVTGATRSDPFGGSTTRYSNGVTATTRPDPLRRLDDYLQRWHACDHSAGSVW